MKKYGNYFLILLPILLLVASTVLAARKKAGPNHRASKVVTECGTALTEPGNYQLAHDLLLNPDDICRNTWEKNQFQTELGVPGCIGAPVELDEKDVCALN